jgi:2-(1,2-epoxy-1,2-dihydrophenyl)acetyl-CoA isomerase
MLSQELETVQLKIEDGVAWVVLNRPDALNAWTRQLGEDLLTAIEHAASSSDVRAIVLTGEGRAFSSGADLKGGFEPNEHGRPDVLSVLRDVYHPLLLRVRSVEKPVISAVNGPAVGIGCSLALIADLVVAAESAYFLMAFVNIGLTMDGGATQILTARVGHTRAFEMGFLGERVSAARALDWGLINQVVPDAELTPTVSELATRFVAGPPGSYGAIKRTLNAKLYDGFAEQLELEAVAQQERANSDDFMEGVLAFMQKRPPEFKGT